MRPGRNYVTKADSLALASLTPLFLIATTAVALAASPDRSTQDFLWGRIADGLDAIAELMINQLRGLPIEPNNDQPDNRPTQ